MKMLKFAWSPTKKTLARELSVAPICSKILYKTLKAQRTKVKLVVNVVNAEHKNKKKPRRVSPNLKAYNMKWRVEIGIIIIKSVPRK